MIKGKQAGVSFSIGRWNGKEWKGVYLSTYYKKSKIFKIIQEYCRQYGHCYVRINYGNSLYNDGVYYTQKDAKEAFSQFIENSLLKYALRRA